MPEPIPTSPGRGTATVRSYHPDDREAIVQLGLRAWTPNFASFQQILGHPIFVHQYGDDWTAYQADAIRTVLASATRIWVAEVNNLVAEFVAVALADDRSGEIEMIAVDPAHDGLGIGASLVQLATDWLQTEGAQIAFIATGGDPAHAPARHAYEGAGYTALPSSATTSSSTTRERVRSRHHRRELDTKLPVQKLRTYRLCPG